MRSVAPIRAAKIGYLIVSALLCLLGIILIALPDFSISLFGTLCGIILIAFGIIKLIGYFSRDLYRLAFQYDFAFGITIISLGIIILCHPTGLLQFLCITLGFSFLADGLFKIQIAIDAKSFGIRRWWLILSLAVVTFIAGIILATQPLIGGRILTVFIGASLLCEGVLNIGTVITAVKIIQHQVPDIYEA